MTGTGCPLCLKYAPTLGKIEEAYRTRGVEFIFINPNESESEKRIRDAISTHGFNGSYVVDADQVIPQLLSASTTTEVFVLDRTRTLVYRGAVDDQYGIGYSLDSPRHSYLTEALDAVIENDVPEIQATTAPGCELFFDDIAKDAVKSVAHSLTVTYHNQISRMIQSHCIECHRDGGIGPMPFETFEQVQDYAGMIRNVIKRGVMPPWFAATDSGSEKSSHVHWANDRTLPDDVKRELFAWIDAGTPEGDPKDAPLPVTFPDGWLIGKPDAVFEFPKPIAVKADGIMPYKNVTVETNLNEDRWVKAIEVRPSNPSVVHHVIVSVRGGERELDERDGYWGAYVPGNSTLIYPEGYARLLPKDTKLRFQMHYTPNGTATEDSTRIGVIFAKEPPQYEVKVAGISNARIRIPPGAANHKEEAAIRLPFDVEVLSFLPHMHLRGKAARYDLLSGGETETLLDIPKYDFNWQLIYQLAEPRPMSAGDTIRFTCWFDNSADNPANPDPTREVRWGQQTEDEMHLGYVEYIVPGAKPGESPEGMRRAKAGTAVRRAINVGLFRRLDVNGDGFVARSEVRKRMPGNRAAAGEIFDGLDANKDDRLDSEEFSKLKR